MEGNKFVTNDKHLETALEQVRHSRKEAEKFASDPKAYLQSKGVKTEGLKFAPPELSDAELEQVAGGTVAKPTVCSSVGCVGCVTVGDDGTAA